MTTKAREGDASELQLELKYCERCGGLWLRPVGGEQIYCVACGRAMAELPGASHKGRGARMPVGKPWAGSEEEFDGDESGAGVDVDSTGGGHERTCGVDCGGSGHRVWGPENCAFCATVV